MDVGIFYVQGEVTKLTSFSNANQAKNIHDPKSTLGYLFLFELSSITWDNKKQLAPH